MAIERIVNTQKKPDDDPEKEVEETLRPKQFSSYVGQKRLKKTLKLAIKAAKQRGDAIDHVMLYGPPGLGKTTMAGVIANELQVNFRTTSGPAIERPGDLASLLTNLKNGDILFIDEMHRLPRTVEEVLYPAMEDFHIDIMLGKGPSARSMRLDLEEFTVIGATTKVGGISGPLRDRFGLVHRLEFYEHDEIVKILKRAARILDVTIKDDAAEIIARRARLTPRIANRLLKRVRDFAQVEGSGVLNGKSAKAALKLLEIDEAGLDSADRQLLEAIIENYKGGPVGVETLAALLAEEKTTIEEVYEPFLMQVGFLERTSQGRKVTHKAYRHLGKEVPEDDQSQLL